MANYLYRRGYREAMRLQTALLALELALPDIPDRELGKDELIATTEALAGHIGEIGNAQLALYRRAPEAASLIPDWLATPSPLAAVGLLQERLAGESGPWPALAEHMGKQNLINRLDGLVAFWQEDLAPSASVDPVPDAAVPDDEERIRIPFPVVHTGNDRGLMLELVLAPQGPGAAPVDDTDREGLSQQFRKAVRAGAKAGLDLARAVGCSGDTTRQWDSVALVDVVGVPRLFPVTQKSAGAPTALALLQHLLELPDLASIVTGELTTDGRIRGVPLEYQDAKAAAAGYAANILAGLAPDIALLTAAERLWPEDWPAAVRRTAKNSLTHEGHELTVIEDVGTNQSANGTTFRLIPTNTSDGILKRLQAGQQQIVIGGPSSSGRTTAVRQAALAWSQEHGTPVLELRVADGRLPDETDLRRHIALARLAEGIGADEPMLLLLEDLLPYDDAIDLDAVLTSVTDGSPTTILAVCSYVGRGAVRWRTDQVATVPSLSREKIRAFAAEFAPANGMAQLSQERLGLLCRTAAGDIWFLTHLLLNEDPLPQPDPGRRRGLALVAASSRAAVADETAAEETAAEAAAAILDAYARRVQAGMSATDLADMQATAASSLLGVGVPETLLSPSARNRLRKIGGQRDRARRWYIRRRATCRALLSQLGGQVPGHNSETAWKRTADQQLLTLSAFLRRSLDKRDDLKVIGFITALLTSAGAVEQRLHRKLLPLVAEVLVRHLRVTAPPVLIAYALMAGGPEYDPASRAALFTLLLESLQIQGWDQLRAREVAICLNAIRLSRELIHEIGPAVPGEPGPQKNVRKLYLEVRNAIDPGIRRALHASSPPQGVLLIHELGQFYEVETSRHIVEMAVLATTRCNPHRVDDYAAAISLIDAAAKYGVRTRSETHDAFAQADGIRRLIDQGGPRDAGLTFARAALVHLVDRRADIGDVYPPRVATEVRRELPRSSPRRIAVGLEQLRRVDVGFARAILRETPLAPWLRGKITRQDEPSASPWEIAELIRTLTTVYAQTVGAVLYGLNADTADPIIVDALARSIMETGDLKGVGHVLSAVAGFDALWGPGGENNSGTQLCSELLSFVHQALTDEVRGSVVYKTMEAMIKAEISPEDLESFLVQCADLVAAEAQDNDKDHNPRLALMLGAHETAGPDFLALLRTRIDDKLLLARMTSGTSVETRVAYIQLARALGWTRNDDFMREFLGTSAEPGWLPVSLPDLHTGNVLTALKAIAAYDLALKDSNWELPVHQLLATVEPNANAWATRLDRLYHPEHLGQALDVFWRLSPRLAHDSLIRLDALHQTGSWANARPLTPRLAPAETPRSGPPTPLDVVRAMRRRRDRHEAPAQKPTGLFELISRAYVPTSEAMKLIRSIRKIDAERADWLGEMLTDTAGWQRRSREFSDIENPVVLGDLLRSTTEARAMLPEHVVDRVLAQWQVLAPWLRSPNAAQSLLRGFAAYYREAEVARTWSSHLTIERVGRRLQCCFANDLQWAGTLLRGLDVWGVPGAASSLAEFVPATATLIVNARPAAELLTALDTVAPRLATRHAEMALMALEVQASRVFVMRPERYWENFGWLARIVRRLLGDIRVAGADRALDGIQQPWLHAWVRGNLGLGIADGAFAATDPKTLAGWPTFMRTARLVIRSDYGLLDEGDAAEFDAVIEGISGRWILEMVRRVAADPAMRALATPEDLSYLAWYGHDNLTIGQSTGAEIVRRLDQWTRPESDLAMRRAS